MDDLASASDIVAVSVRISASTHFLRGSYRQLLSPCPFSSRFCRASANTVHSVKVGLTTLKILSECWSSSEASTPPSPRASSTMAREVRSTGVLRKGRVSEGKRQIILNIVASEGIQSFVGHLVPPLSMTVAQDSRTASDTEHPGKNVTHSSTDETKAICGSLARDLAVGDDIKHDVRESLYGRVRGDQA